MARQYVTTLPVLPMLHLGDDERPVRMEVAYLGNRANRASPFGHGPTRQLKREEGSTGPLPRKPGYPAGT